MRSAKRVYTRPAIEAWLTHLSQDWERCFCADELKYGRDIYRRGEIRELELSDSDVIIHARLTEADGYALVDWSEGVLAVRGSFDRAFLSRSLAIAGLYEVEELLAEEVDPVGLAVEPVVAEVAVAPTATEKLVEQAPPRKLVVRFDTTERGMRFRLYWLEENGKRTPALQRKGSELSSSERELLIRIASLAHKSGFRYAEPDAAYVQQDLTRLAGFLREEMPSWEQYFTIEKDDEVERLQRGVQEVDLAAIVGEDESGGLKVDWSFRVGEGLLSEREGALLLRHHGQPFILPGKGLVRVRQRERDIHAQWQELRAAGKGGLPRYLLFSLFDRLGKSVQLSAELEQWYERLRSQPQTSYEVPAFLRPYQQFGVRWMMHLFDCDCHGLLADEMGLGKTLQVLSLLHARPVAKMPSLIVCPASVIPVWEKEIERFFPTMTVRVLGVRNTFVDHPQEGLWLASYTQIRRYKQQLTQVEFGYAVLDEGQFIKNPDAKVTQACCSIQARHRLVLTGTPLENRQLDLWTLFRFLMPGLLGKRSVFEDRLQAGSEEFLRRLQTQVAPFVLRRTKQEVVRELPAKVEIDLYCPLSDIQRREYRRLIEEGMARLGGDAIEQVEGGALSVLTLLTRLRQVCCDPGLLPWLDADVSQSGKLNVLGDKLTDLLLAGGKVVVFSQFVRLLERAKIAVQQRFPTVQLYELTGKTNDRGRPVEAFQQQEGAAVFFVSLKAGGTGITLHAAENVFLLDPWWNPAVEDQAIDRVHRIGQDKTVFVYRLITEGTLEERIQRLKGEKRDLFSGVIGGLNAMTDFSSYYQNLNELIALLPDRQKR